MAEGFEKFVGMGLVQRSMQEMLSGKKARGKLGRTNLKACCQPLDKGHDASK